MWAGSYSSPLSVIQQRASSRDVPHTCPDVAGTAMDKVDKDPSPMVTVPRVFLAPSGCWALEALGTYPNDRGWSEESGMADKGTGG